MKKIWKHKSPSLLIMGAAVLAFLLLGIVQYQLVVQVNRDERERKRETVRASAIRFSEDFDRELARVYLNFRMDVTTLRQQAWKRYAQRYVHWVTSAPYPKLVKNVFLVDVDEQGGLRVARFTPSTSRFEPDGWLGDMAGLRERFEQAYRMTRREGDEVVGGTIDPVIDDLPALVIRVPRRWQLSDQQAIGFDTDLLADEGQLLLQQRRCVGCKQPANATQLFAYTVVILDRTYIQQEFIPMLARRHFAHDSGFDYQVAVISRETPTNVIYRSESDGYTVVPESGDAIAGIFSLRIEEFSSLLIDSALRLNPSAGDSIDSPISIVRPIPNDPPPIDAPPPGADGRWELLVRDRAGSLEAAVENLRRQDLLISFSSLLLLAIGVVMVFVSTRRSLRLAQQQMEFVAAVSHELRTPLAVICSAGDNLAAGVINDTLQTRRYGAVIRGEGHRLARMVEQVLEFAGTQAGKQTYTFSMIDIGSLVESALAACRSQLDECGFTIETHIQPHLPPVSADAAALGRSIQNLIVNAIKYSSEHRWIGVDVHVRKGERSPEIRISIQDRGIGIAPEDLPHIFEPFYRGKEVIAAQIHGNGLGLRLVKHIIEAHGGHVSVKSTPGQGSIFTLHLPCQVSLYTQPLPSIPR